VWNRWLKEDMPECWQLGFSDAGGPTMEEIIFFHDEVMYILMIIIVFVFWVIIKALTIQNYHKYLFEGPLIEMI